MYNTVVQHIDRDPKTGCTRQQKHSNDADWTVPKSPCSPVVPVAPVHLRCHPNNPFVLCSPRPCAVPMPTYTYV